MWLSIFALVISVLVLGFTIWSAEQAKKRATKRKDQNVEWMGPDVCLKKKHYPEMKDDFRQKVADE